MRMMMMTVPFSLHLQVCAAAGARRRESGVGQLWADVQDPARPSRRVVQVCFPLDTLDCQETEGVRLSLFLNNYCQMTTGSQFKNNYFAEK